jgi:hypothetical protein
VFLLPDCVLVTKACTKLVVKIAAFLDEKQLGIFAAIEALFFA